MTVPDGMWWLEARPERFPRWLERQLRRARGRHRRRDMPGYDINMTMAAGPATAILEIDFAAPSGPRPTWVGPVFFDVWNASGHRAQAMRERAQAAKVARESEGAGGGEDPEGTLGDGK